MTQDLNLVVNGNESGNASEGCTVLSASISDPYVLLTMTDGSIRLLVGGMSKNFQIVNGDDLYHIRFVSVG